MVRERNQQKLTERLTFLHSNNVNITAIQENKPTSNTKRLKTPWFERHKNKGGGLLMQIKDTTPFVDNTAAQPQSSDSHLGHQGISITMSIRQRLHIHNVYIPPRCSCSTGNYTSNALLISKKKMSPIAGDTNAHHSRWDTNRYKEERGEQPADVIDTADYTILRKNEAMRLPTFSRSNSSDFSLTSNDIAMQWDWLDSNSLANDHPPILITINSELSTIDGPRRTHINF